MRLIFANGYISSSRNELVKHLGMERIEQEIREIFAKMGASLHDDLSKFHKGEWCPMQQTFCQEG